ncbi:MAG: iron-sulfur cluster assembly scaffold protein [Candidatus Aenigmatarchaeota archaeon]
MYKQEILDLYKNPRNKGKLDTDLEEVGENPSCGDITHVYLKTEDGKVTEMKHETDGCAISTAAVSILSDEIKGMQKEKVKKLDREWMIDRLGIDISPMRVKCAVLGLKTVQSILEGE